MDENILNWIVGFVEGEGCFTLTVSEKVYANTKSLQLHPVFQISIGENDKQILDLIKNTLGIGTITKKPKIYWERFGFTAQNQFNYRVSNVMDCKKIYSFFNGKMLSSKNKSMQTWYACLMLIEQYKHLTKEGLIEILLLRDNINGVSKRKNYKDYNYYLKIVEDMDAKGFFSEYWYNRKKKLAECGRVQVKGNNVIYKNIY